MPRNSKRTIDLNGPDGNAFALLGYVKTLSKQLGIDGAAIRQEMLSGNYDNLVAVFEEHFGDYVDIIHVIRKFEDDDEEE